MFAGLDYAFPKVIMNLPLTRNNEVFKVIGSKFSNICLSDCNGI